MFVGFADCRFGDVLFGFHDGAVAVVLRGYLEAVDEDPGAAGVDSICSQGQDYLRDG